jgi:hypothetical protein
MATKCSDPTIAFTALSSSRFARVKLRHPDGTLLRWPARFSAHYPSQVEVPECDAVLVMKLVGNFGDLSAGKHDLVVIISHYRHALHALATQMLIGQTGSNCGGL